MVGLHGWFQTSPSSHYQYLNFSWKMWFTKCTGREIIPNKQKSQNCKRWGWGYRHDPSLHTLPIPFSHTKFENHYLHKTCNPASLKRLKQLLLMSHEAATCTIQCKDTWQQRGSGISNLLDWKELSFAENWRPTLKISKSAQFLLLKCAWRLQTRDRNSISKLNNQLHIIILAKVQKIFTRSQFHSPF